MALLMRDALDAAKKPTIVLVGVLSACLFLIAILAGPIYEREASRLRWDSAWSRGGNGTGAAGEAPPPPLPEFPPACDASCKPPLEWQRLWGRIPRVVNFIWYSIPGSGFGYSQFLSVLAARVFVRPHCICFHINPLDPEPAGPWWQAVRRFVTVREARVVSEIMGNPVNVFAHKSDVFRIELMMAHGGIYFDTDVYALRSFDDLLNQTSPDPSKPPPATIMGHQADGGLCNAVIISEPKAPFLELWYASYATFNDGAWDEHSVRMSARIAGEHPDLIRRMPPHAFFDPDWSQTQLIFEGEPPPLRQGEGPQYALHLWHKVSEGRMDQMTPEKIRRDGGGALIDRVVLSIITAAEREGLM